MAGLSKLIAALLLLPAGAASAAPTPLPGSGYHQYVRGRYAWASEEIGRASSYFAGALAANPADKLLLRRTFDLALAAGNKEVALKAGAQLAKIEPGDATVGLLQVVSAFERRDWAAADRARAALGEVGPAAFASPVIEAWTLVGRGKKKDALARLSPDTHSGFARAYVAEHRAHVLSAIGRHAEAADAYRALIGADGRTDRLRLAAAEAMQRADRRDEALRMLDGGLRDPVVVEARERLAAGKPIGGAIADPRRGLAELLTRIALDLARERPLPVSLVMARLATFIAPEAGEPWIVTADILARGGQSEPALAALKRVPADAPLALMAQARAAGVLQGAERGAESVALLERVVASGGRFDDWARLGEAYQAAERYADAARAFDRSLSLPGGGGAERWYLHFARGSARERAGDWAAAQADLREAIRLAPQQAAPLNYLGYAMLDRGEKLDEARTLIERAVALKPDDGYIVDSLGWAHFVAGRYKEAVATLERAVAAVPDDATISEHLGDAYWRVGRRVDARFAWKAALDAGPEPDAKARVLAKLDYGLDVATARR
jgi:tetratricopeptide (TPR) repeat protein